MFTPFCEWFNLTVDPILKAVVQGKVTSDKVSSGGKGKSTDLWDQARL